MNLIRNESTTIVDGCSLLDVRGSDFGAVLLVSGKPLLYHWSDCRGSVAQHLIYCSALDAMQAAFSFRTKLEVAPKSEVSLASYLNSVLPILAPGQYDLALYDAPQSYSVVNFNSHWDIQRDSTGYYPGCGSFVTTESTSELNEERISHYYWKIREGERPTLLTISVEDGWSDFVIDGHHKLAAYMRNGMPAHYLSIQRKNAPRISMADMRSYVPLTHPLREQCEAVKSKWDCA